MLFQKIRLALTLFVVSLTLAACGGGGDKADAPVGGITATPGNGQVTITWTAVPGVEYWVAYAANASAIDMSNLPANHLWVTNVTSPYVLTGLTNGVTYAFAMNARTNGGPGGPQTASKTAVPRMAGISGSWLAGTALTNPPSSPATTLPALRGLTYDGTNFVAVGDAGSIYKSTDGAAWTGVAGANTGTNNLSAVQYVNSTVGYVAADTSGHVYQGTDLAALALATTPPTNVVNGLTTDGTTMVAVGNNGSISYSTNGTTWTAAATVPATASALRAVTVYGGIWVAVGDNGTVFTSTTLTNWAVPTSYTTVTNHLHGVAGYGASFVAVGDGGVVVSSVDSGATWTSQQLTLNGTSTHPNLYAVNIASGQYLCAGAAGAAFTSPDLATWTTQYTGNNNTNISSDLLALIGSPSAYYAVGTAGTNAVSK